MNSEQAKAINNSIGNVIYVVPIDSEDAKCNPKYNNGKKSYKDTNHKVFKHGEVWYVQLDRDKNGNPLRQISESDSQLLDLNRLKELLSIFGDSMIEYAHLPELDSVIE